MQAMPGAWSTLILIIIFLLMEWNGRNQQYAIAELGLSWKKPVRSAAYYAIIIAIMMAGGQGQDFIYFQF